MALIKLQHGKQSKLAQDFGVSLVTVRAALRGKTKSDLANMLRKAAIERGAQVYTLSSNQPVER